jgi:hypothetical protein
VVFAQATRPWPRNAATSKIEFIGQLPWPDSVRTEAQRQLLVRRWYRRKLTNTNREDIITFVRIHGTTYGGIPKQSCYRLHTTSAYDNLYSLCFQLNFIPDSTGLTYRLSDFEFSEFEYDAGSTASLESSLLSHDNSLRSFIELFHGQLLGATKGW